MTTKADFNAEEWSTLVEAPLLAGMGVVTAERAGTLRESLAIGKTYAAARQQHGESSLLDAIVASPPAIDPSRLREGGSDVQQLATARLRDAVTLVEAKAQQTTRSPTSSSWLPSPKRWPTHIAKAASQESVASR